MANSLSERRGLIALIFIVLAVCAVALVITRCRPVVTVRPVIEVTEPPASENSESSDKPKPKPGSGKQKKAASPRERSPLDEPV